MDRQKNRFLTSEIANLLGIGRNTLRLYEEKGLLTNLKRTESGYREYSENDLKNLRFILEAKKTGFTLNEIKILLETIESKKKLTCGSVSVEISDKVQEIENEISALKSKKTFLEQFLKTCAANKSENECDIGNAGFSKTACCQ